MSFDLLVYGEWPPDEEELITRWQQAMTEIGLTLELPLRFSLSRHAGSLPLGITLTEETPLSGETVTDEPCRGAGELYLERFTGTFDADAGLEDVPAPLAKVIREASFCAVFTLSHHLGPTSCVAAFLAAVALARVTDGVLAGDVDDRYWDPEQAMAHAERYLRQVLDQDASV
jgi:hypothetical protein